MINEYIIFGKPCIGNEEIDEVIDSLKKGWIGTGPKVNKFERNFATYKNVGSAIAVNSCTAALHLSLLSCDLSDGDEVITTAMSFTSTANSIINAGGTPIFVDIDIDTYNINIEEIEKKVTKKTKAILVVHFAGYPLDMPKILEIAAKYNLLVIEDCAHAIETICHNKAAGTWGDFGAFSFYSTKNITTGEGGMLISKDVTMQNKLKTKALHGMSHDAWKRFSDEGYSHYDVHDVGFKYNMMDLQAALGIHQLKKIDKFYEIRKKQWFKYKEHLSDLPLKFQADVKQTYNLHAYHLFTIRIDPLLTKISRDELLAQLHQKRIGAGVHYRAIPNLSFYSKKYNIPRDQYKNANHVGENILSLPFGPALTDVQQNYVINVLRDIFKNEKF